jgi:hypothetical protein
LECELQNNLDALKNQHEVLDKQSHSLDEKDEHIEILEKQLLEVSPQV